MIGAVSMGGKGEKARAMARAGPNARQASGGIGFMENSVSRILVETVVKRTLRDMKEDPERSIRNLIDRALLVSEGRFQKRFFQTAQRMLHNERSAYYPLVRSLVENVEHARLLGFGMNVGYNSCTVCAKKIRALEAAEGFNIPWSLYLEIHADRFHKNRQRYASLLDEGKALGIYTWFFHADGFSADLFRLMALHPDCAFVLLCPPEGMDGALVGEAERLNHLMLGVGLNAQAERVCRTLRERKMLYGVYCRYGEDRLDDILSDSLLHEAQALGAPFTLFLPETSCRQEMHAKVYDYVRRIRDEQRFPTIPYELFRDSMAVDTVISDDGCSVGFRADGSFFMLADCGEKRRVTFCERPLRDILRTCLPKRTNGDAILSSARSPS